MATAQNFIIARLPAKDRLRLLATCEAIELTLGQVLCEPGKPTPHAYFPVDSFISLVAKVDGSPGVEVGMAGREGMLGAQLALGVATAPWHAVVQGSGSAWRVSTPVFRRELARSAALQRCLKNYLYVLLEQHVASATCLRFHLTGQRLARWLLMSQDRAHSDTFHVTHEFLAYMLGMRRAGITGAASDLQRSGLIAYRRGELTVLDRPGLEAAACSCYAADRKTYADLLG